MFKRISILLALPLLAGAALMVPRVAAWTAVPLGTVNCDGGSESVPMDPAAFLGGGGAHDTATGTAVNQLGPGVIMDDLTVSIKGTGGTGTPSAGQVTVNGTPVNMTTATGGEAGTVSNLGVTGNGTAAVTVDGINTGGCGTMSMNFTPSTKTDIVGVAVDANIATAYRFSQTSDLMRNGVGELWHGVVVAGVSNSDTQADVTALSGGILLPQGSTVTLVRVLLKDALNSFAPVSGTSVSITGNTFTLTGFTPLTDTGAYLLVLELSQPLTGQRFQCEIEATF